MMTKEAEYAICPPPNCTSPESRFAKVVGIERLPVEIVKEVVLNPSANDQMLQRFKYLVSSDYLTSACRMTVPLQTCAESLTWVLVSKFWERCIPLGYSTGIPYGEKFIGGMIMGKGCFLNGDLYGQKGKNEIDPWGFFGRKEAEREIYYSNNLLSVGFRTALPLGYLILDEAKLKGWLQEKWKDCPPAVAQLERSIQIIKNNNDVPVYSFRVTGVDERLEQPVEFLSGRRRRDAFARAARLMLVEMATFPRNFGYYLKAGSKGNVEAVLSKISQKKRLTKEELHEYFDLVIGIVQQNVLALDRIPRLLRNDDTVGIYLGEPKDLDLAMFHQDYEEIEERRSNVAQTERQIKLYLTNMYLGFFHFLRQEASVLTGSVRDRGKYLHDFCKAFKTQFHSLS